MSQVELVIAPREKDLGGFFVRRVLPYATHRMVGPFIFFDHMGPAVIEPGQGMDVRPHPHIGLATVTYLFEGRIFHRDSLGSKQIIEPGAINWMTAGRGIVHSERSPDDFRKTGGRVNGIQIWVALPQEKEDTAPTFVHHPADTLPAFEKNGVKIKLLLGEAYGFKSPVQTLSQMFYLELLMPKGTNLDFPAHGEAAAYVVNGKVDVDDQTIEMYSMAVIKKCSTLTLKAQEDSRVMLIGGKPVGERFIFWNLVSSSQEKIEKAKQEYAQGPRIGGTIFPAIPDDQAEYIPLPQEAARPKGTVM